MSDLSSELIHFIDDIYEISVGLDPKTALRYTKGQHYMGGKVRITEIVYDQNSYFTHGQRRLYVYADIRKDTGKVEEELWKIVEDLPVMITREVK